VVEAAVVEVAEVVEVVAGAVPLLRRSTRHGA
jgi:hypothetical protein